jgi:hypothetical protein
MARWYLIARPSLRLWDRLRLLAGVPLFVRFESPDGRCHAACHITASVERDWPDTERYAPSPVHVTPSERDPLAPTFDRVLRG